MLKKSLFKKPNNELEGNLKLSSVPSANVPDEMCVACPACKKMIFTSELLDNLNVCPHCGYHFRLSARKRLRIFEDENTFAEHDEGITSENILDFPGYEKKLDTSMEHSAESEAVVCGVCKIGGYDCAIFVMEPYFMMGSMGTVVGEKITRLFEYALKEGLPVLGFTLSGGARMQEGILSLMQMAKVSAAVKRHSDAGNLYTAVLCDPTSGGVTASFAMEADIILAEPGALICFAGPRVIEQTIRQKLPQGFQRAEFLLEKGFVDEIVPRTKLKDYIVRILRLHAKEVRQNDGI